MSKLLPLIKAHSPIRRRNTLESIRIADASAAPESPRAGDASAIPADAKSTGGEGAWVCSSETGSRIIYDIIK